jgi:hypothetical protein
MRRTARLFCAAGLSLSVTLTATLAPAQTTATAPEQGGDRCFLLGQITAAHWLNLLGKLGSLTASDIDPAMVQVQGSAALYQTLACDMPALSAAMDCILTSDAARPAQDRARECLYDAGLSRSR